MGHTEKSNGADLPPEIASALRELRSQSLDCPPPDLLQAAHEGVLPPELAEPVLRHSRTCGTCKSLLQDLADVDETPLEIDQQRIWNQVEAGFRSTPARISTASRTAWFWRLMRPWPAAVVAAAVIVLIAASLLRQRQPTVAIQPPRPVEVTKPSAVLALEKAPIILPPAALLVWRGQQRDTDPWKELQPALLAYQSDDYAKAAALLEPLTVKYPNMAEAWFYLGVSRLFLNANVGAPGNLEEARRLAQPPLADHAGWYLALAYERTGRVADARKLLEALCGGGGAVAGKACQGLQTLPAR